MQIAIQFDRRDDLSNRREIVESCLTTAERSTSRWDPEDTLVFSTDRSLSSVAIAWECQGFSFEEFPRVTVTDDSADTRVRSIVMPGALDIHPLADRLVGREHRSLTATEKEIHERFSLNGEFYFADFHPDGLVVTDVGHPGQLVDIRVHPDTPAYDAAWELARVVDYYLNELPQQ